jgi:hypothetical protein
MVQEGKVDVIPHAPMDHPIDGEDTKVIKDEGGFVS